MDALPVNVETYVSSSWRRGVRIALLASPLKHPFIHEIQKVGKPTVI